MILDAYDKVSLYLESTGFVVWPLLLCAAVLWYGIGFRLLALRRGNVRSVRVLVHKCQAGVALSPKGVIDSAIVTGVEATREQQPHLRRRLDEALGPYEEQIDSFRAATKTVVVIAPLLGLLGTVIGMVETFDSLGDMSLFSQSGGVAGGISQALFSTQLGLAVAVPGLVISRILNRKQDVLSMELAKVKDILCVEAREQGAKP